MIHLTEAEEATFVRDHMPLAKKEAFAFYSRLPHIIDADDIYSEALYRLVLAARTFDSEKGFTFGTWAKKCLHNAMINYMRSNTAGHVASDDAHAHDHQQRSVHLWKTGRSPVPEVTDFFEEGEEFAAYDDALEMVEQLEALLGWMETLSEQERYLVRLRLAHSDINQTECARKLAARFGEYWDQAKVSGMLKTLYTRYKSELAS